MDMAELYLVKIEILKQLELSPSSYYPHLVIIMLESMEEQSFGIMVDVDDSTSWTDIEFAKRLLLLPAFIKINPSTNVPSAAFNI